MGPPFFTVIVPVHDGARFVLAAIESVLSQAENDFELIVVDDGSTDATPEVLRSVSDPRLRVHTQAPSGTPAGARNGGLRLARGTFTAFLDADDTWTADKLSVVRRIFGADPELDIASHGVRLLSNGRRVGTRAYELEAERSLYEQLLYRGNFLTTSATVVRTARVLELGGFDESPNRRIGEDFDLWLRMAATGSRALVLPVMLGTYEVGRGVSADLRRGFENTFDLLDSHYEALAREGKLDSRQAIRRRVRARLRLARESLRRGGIAPALGSIGAVPFESVSRLLRYRRLSRRRV